MKRISVILLTLVMVLGSCTKTYVYINDMDEDAKMYDLYVDEFGNKGIVMYVYKSAKTKYCLVMSLDEGEEAWGYENELVYDLQYDSVKITSLNAFGMDMLNIMYQNGMAKYPAQQWCFGKNHGAGPSGRSWRLPSFSEWLMMMKDVSTAEDLSEVNRYIEFYGGEPLVVNDYYWTCTEDLEGVTFFDDTTLNVYDPASRAVNLTPLITAYTDKYTWSKQNRYRVRAIKCVYYAKKENW